MAWQGTVLKLVVGLVSTSPRTMRKRPARRSAPAHSQWQVVVPYPPQMAVPSSFPQLS